MNKMIELAYNSVLNNSIDTMIKDFDFNLLTDSEFDELTDKLFCYWFDVRKALDEQTRCNGRIFPNYFLYEAYEAEAKSKYLYLQHLQNERIAHKEKEVK